MESFSPYPKVAVSVAEDAIKILHELITSLPAFWGVDDLAQIIKICVQYQTKDVEVTLAHLMKTLVKKVPPKVLLSAILAVWPDVFPKPVCNGYLSIGFSSAKMP